MSQTAPSPAENPGVAELEAATQTTPAAPNTPAATPAPGAPNTPPTPIPPTSAGPGEIPEGAQILDPNKPLGEQVQPAPGTPPAPGAPTVPDGLTAEAALAYLLPDTPNFLKGPDGKIDPKQLSDWKGFRQLHTELGKKLDAGGGGQDLEAYKREHEETVKAMEEFNARIGIEDSPAFREKYDQARVGLKSDVERFAASAGMEGADVATLLNQPDELAVLTFLQEKLPDNAAAQTLIGQKAGEFVRLGNERNATLRAEDPVKALADWQTRSETAAGQQAQQLTEAEKAQSIAALERLEQEMPGKDPYYTTATGKKTLATVREIVTGNNPIDREVVISALMEADAKEVYAAAYTTAQQKIAQLEAQLAQARGLRPGAQPAAVPGAPTTPSTAPAPTPSSAAGPIKIERG